MCPLLIVGAIAFYLYQRNNNPEARTQKAFELREAELRTSVTERDVQGWVNTLKFKDPAFELAALLDKVKTAFTKTQEAWFARELLPVRPFLSDAMYQRLKTQLALLSDQGIRNAIADLQIQDVQLIGLDQSEWYDTVHVRVEASLRDVDVAANTPDDAALAAAQKANPEAFVEVWSFVRKPGAQTRIGADLFQGKCPNCGAPYKGGASNTCEFCGAVVNSGNYDWTLSEITQGIEHVRGYATVDGLLDARKEDPALNLEILQDRTSLIFWKWVDAESRGEPKRLAKLATPEFLASLSTELGELKRQGRHKVFLECAVGAVTARTLRTPPGFHEAHVEIRWSARLGVGPIGQPPPKLPTLPQRWVFSLRRAAGAKTNTANGVSTSRCPQCNAPLSDSLTASCEFCGFQLDTGERDWVLWGAYPFERWNVVDQERFDAQVAEKRVAPPGDDAVLDAQERERLLYMMAAIAAADGVVTPEERKMLQTFSKRWSIPWDRVQTALEAGPQLFDRLVPAAGSKEAELVLRTLVSIALVDGRVDKQERRMLEAAAEKLGLQAQLTQMLGR